jgi:hypothetical protein
MRAKRRLSLKEKIKRMRKRRKRMMKSHLKKKLITWKYEKGYQF